jgi:Domain of unknown function (DUF4266)
MVLVLHVEQLCERRTLEKNTLALETMQSEGPLPGLARTDGHVYFSKEAARGGTGVGGGGCGCN